MYFRNFILTGCLAVCSGFDLPFAAAQRQGIEGIVRNVSGNHMPSPRRVRTLPAGIPATVCIFGLTNDSQVVRQGSSRWYTSIGTPLIQQSDTDSGGRFHVFLPPGTYSVFVKKGDRFYATRRDEKNNIAPVEVLPGKMVRVECSVESDHKAVY